MNIEKPIHTYNNEIVPKVKEIDILLKSNENISLKKASSLLDITESQLEDILIKINEKEINSSNFLRIMLNGTSFICKILKRELECGSPYFYNAKDLSYIYELDYEKVLNAYRFLDLDKVTAKQIPAILAQI